MDGNCIKIILDEIAFLCNKYLEKKDFSNTPLGLYSGGLGILLFLILYKREFPNSKITDSNIDLLMSKLIEQWCDAPDLYSYCMGSAGILDLLCFLNKNECYQIDLSESEAVLDKYIASRMLHDLKLGNYDFLHGALGAAFYFLNNGKRLEDIERSIIVLHKIANKEGNHYSWNFTNFSDGKQMINIGLSHGMSSILIFLSKAYKNNICKELTAELLIGCANYILEQKLDTISKNQSMFPTLSKSEGLASSRLAWCYGDLGIALALWKGGKSINSDRYISSAREIAQNALSRKDMIENMIEDAGICHGTAGVAMMFDFFWREMGISHALFLKQYWLSQTVSQISIPVMEIESSNWCAGSYCLLEGASGIGLVLLSTITEDDSWTQFFMLK